MEEGFDGLRGSGVPIPLSAGLGLRGSPGLINGGDISLVLVASDASLSMPARDPEFVPRGDKWCRFSGGEMGTVGRVLAGNGSGNEPSLGVVGLDLDLLLPLP